MAAWGGYIFFWGENMIRFFIFILCPLIGFAKTAQLQYAPGFILNKVLERKHHAFDSQKIPPQVLFASQVTLKQFQDDVEPQWGIRPDAITNVYVVDQNKIYLMDDAEYYDKTGRCMDDSLAHELTHFVQVVYEKWDISDDSTEWDAIDVQTWFRETYCH